MALTEQQRTERQANMRDAIHSIAMEGGEVDRETQERMAAYARGEITAGQLTAWTADHARLIAAADHEK